MRHRHWQKPPGTATPSAYRHRASRRLYPPPANNPRKFALSKAQVRLAQAAMAHRDTSVAELCSELGIRPVTLYRYVGPQGSCVSKGEKVLAT